MMMTSSYDNLSALSSSDSSTDDDGEGGNYWDEAWVADDNEAEERQRWLERERELEARHRRREAKQRRLDERWAAAEKLRCEARDLRLAEEAEIKRNMAAAAASSPGIMTRYGAKKNKTMIILRNMVARDTPTITTTDESSPSSSSSSSTATASQGQSGMTRTKSTDINASPAVAEAKKFERPPLVRRRSGSEADLRRYAHQLTVASPRPRSGSSSASPPPSDEQEDGGKASGNNKKKNNKDKTVKKSSEKQHDPIFCRENTVALLPRQQQQQE